MTHRFKKCISLLVIGTMLTAMTQSVAFTRDANNRITAITDPSGKSINYVYNASGDLITVTNRNSEASRFSYNRSHGLTDYTDPRGTVTARYHDRRQR